MGDGGDTETVTHDDDGTRADTLTILSLNWGVQPEFGKCDSSFPFLIQAKHLHIWQFVYFRQNKDILDDNNPSSTIDDK